MTAGPLLTSLYYHTLKHKAETKTKAKIQMIIYTKDDTELVIPVGLGPNVTDTSVNQVEKAQTK